MWAWEGKGPERNQRAESWRPGVCGISRKERRIIKEMSFALIWRKHEKNVTNAPQGGRKEAQACAEDAPIVQARPTPPLSSAWLCRQN